MVRRRDWVERLGNREIEELESVVRRVEESGIELEQFRAEDVALPTLAPRLNAILDEVLNGRGFGLIRSLPVER